MEALRIFSSSTRPPLRGASVVESMGVGSPVLLLEMHSATMHEWRRAPRRNWCIRTSDSVTSDMVGAKPREAVIDIGGGGLRLWLEMRHSWLLLGLAVSRRSGVSTMVLLGMAMVSRGARIRGMLERWHPIMNKGCRCIVVRG